MNYQDVAAIAESKGLLLAEYGDGSDYSNAEAYCYWNKSGKRSDPHEIYIEYNFDGMDDKGWKNRAGTVLFFDIKDN